MLDKIRAHSRAELPADYQPNLGRGFDESCVTFLRVSYPAVVELVRQGRGDEEVLQWCLANGRKPSSEDIHVWNTYMRNAAGTMKFPKYSSAENGKPAWLTARTSARCSTSSMRMKAGRSPIVATCD